MKKPPKETPPRQADLQPLLFQAPNRRELRVTFDEPRLTSDVGLILLMQAPQTRDYITKFAAAIADPRSRAPTGSTK